MWAQKREKCTIGSFSGYLFDFKGGRDAIFFIFDERTEQDFAPARKIHKTGVLANPLRSVVK